MKKPFCFIIPHGGYKVPDELADFCTLSELELFFEADTAACECFALKEIGTVITTPVHRLFIDVDRDPYSLPPKAHNGVIKTVTSQKKQIFPPGIFPDEIAIAAMIKRYWFPFHSRIEQACKTSRFIIVCHTIAPVAPPIAPDAGSPRPIITLEHGASNGSDITTCDQTAALKLLGLLKKAFAGEKYTVTTPFSIGTPAKRYIMYRYAKHLLPIIRISLSKALFLNEKYFDPHTLSIDPQRIQSIQQRLYECLHTFSKYI
ncbi:MAG: N-formylglutamate amidohydrolase [Spirochaetes bacterium]|nr:N-formylglutamate amidohydrolase [Spirochaetota bacterium]